MKKFFSLLCAVLVTTLVFGQSYGILVNGSIYFAGEPAGENEGFTQYLAHVQLQQGDYCQLYDADNEAAWVVTLNQWSVEGFTLNNDRYEVAVDGCYDFYIKLKYQADELYIGNGSNCGEGVDISGGGEEPAGTAVYDWAGEIGTTILGASGVEVSTVKIHTNTDAVSGIKFGSSYVYADGKYIAIKPAQGGFKAGDKVNIAVCFNNSDDSKQAQIKAFAADGATELFMTAQGINGRTAATDPAVETFTLAADQDSILLGRYGNTATFITTLNVTRVAGEEPVETPKFYITGQSLVGSWEPNALPSYDTTYVFENLAAGEYVFKITVDGTWQTAKGFTNLTAQTPGVLQAETDDNIYFKLDEAGDVSITYNAENFTVAGNFYVAPVQLPTVAVAGSMNGWSDAANVMTAAEDGLTATATIALEADNYDFKMVVGGRWLGKAATYDITRENPNAAGIDQEIAYGPNLVLHADAAGDYTFTWFFANDSLAIEFPEAPEQVKQYMLYGEAAIANGENWNENSDINVMTTTDEGLTYTLTMEGLQLQGPHTYEFKIIEKGNNQMEYYPRQYGANAGLYIAESGIYTLTFIYTVATQNCVADLQKTGDLEPAQVDYYLVGSFNEWTASEEYKFEVDPDLETQFILTATLAENDEFKVIKVEEGVADPVWYPAEGGNYVVDAAHAGEKLIYFRPEYDGGDGWFAGCIYVAANPTPEPELTNGYYLVGSMNEWTPAAEYLFSVNAGAGEGIEEYVLNTTLEEGQELKVAAVLNDAIAGWFPGEGVGNYVVDAEHAGAVVIYFRPLRNGEWGEFGGFFYIALDDPSDITNIDANVEAVKVLRDAQILIIKGNKTYNVQGQLVK